MELQEIMSAARTATDCRTVTENTQMTSESRKRIVLVLLYGFCVSRLKSLVERCFLNLLSRELGRSEPSSVACDNLSLHNFLPSEQGFYLHINGMLMSREIKMASLTTRCDSSVHIT